MVTSLGAAYNNKDRTTEAVIAIAKWCLYCKSLSGISIWPENLLRKVLREREAESRRKQGENGFVLVLIQVQINWNNLQHSCIHTLIENNCQREIPFLSQIIILSVAFKFFSHFHTSLITEITSSPDYF
jgi:hypothetical protein